MKKLLFVAALLFTVSSIQAQEKIKIKSGNETYKHVGKQPSIIMSIPYTNMDDASKALKKEMKNWKGKVDKNDNEYFLDDGELKEMGENTFDAYSKVYKDVDDKIWVSIAVNLGGAYMIESEHPDKYRAIKKQLYSFCQNTALDGLKNQIDASEDILKDHKKELKGLVKDKEDYEEDIQDLKEEIKEIEGEIKTNESNQEKEKEKISNQKNIIKELNELKSKFK